MRQVQPMDEYIQERFLDLVEKKPFYHIKVSELVKYAEIGRSTFYTYFDSIYAVAQKAEDDFLDGFLPHKDAIAIMTKADAGALKRVEDFLSKNARVLNIMGGPNGDASFNIRLERYIDGLCDSVWKTTAVSYTSQQRDFVRAYISAGTLSTLRFWCRKAEAGHTSDLEGMVEMVLISISKMLQDKSNKGVVLALSFDSNDL